MLPVQNITEKRSQMLTQLDQTINQVDQQSSQVADFANEYGFVPFYTKEEAPLTGFLGNTYPIPVVYVNPNTKEELQFSSVEAAFQSAKFIRTPEVQREFVSLNGDEAFDKAQELGKRSEIFSDEDKAEWRKRNGAVLQGLLQTKFENPEMRTLLLSTGNAWIVEHMPSHHEDGFYGDNGNGTGRNRMGRLLMEERARIRGEAITHNENGEFAGNPPENYQPLIGNVDYLKTPQKV